LFLDPDSGTFYSYC